MTEVSERVGGIIQQEQGFYVDPEEENKGCAYYFKMFDDKILRPILIYKYNQTKFVKEVDFEQVLEEKDARACEQSNYMY